MTGMKGRLIELKSLVENVIIPPFSIKIYIEIYSGEDKEFDIFTYGSTNINSNKNKKTLET